MKIYFQNLLKFIYSNKMEAHLVLVINKTIFNLQNLYKIITKIISSNLDRLIF